MGCSAVWGNGSDPSRNPHPRRTGGPPPGVVRPVGSMSHGRAVPVSRVGAGVVAVAGTGEAVGAGGPPRGAAVRAGAVLPRPVLRAAAEGRPASRDRGLRLP